MAAEGMPFPWRWTGGTISTDLDVIWGISVEWCEWGSRKRETVMGRRVAALFLLMVVVVTPAAAACTFRSHPIA